MKLDLDFSDVLATAGKEESDIDDSVSLTKHPKTEARLAAIQAVYRNLLLGDDQLVIFKTFNPAYLKKREVHAKLFALLTEGVLAERARYQSIVEPLLSDNWKWARLGYVEQSILLCALAELDLCPQTPLKVIINEFLTLSHGYFTPKDVAFINGVLDKAAAQLRL